MSGSARRCGRLARCSAAHETHFRHVDRPLRRLRSSPTAIGGGSAWKGLLSRDRGFLAMQKIARECRDLPRPSFLLALTATLSKRPAGHRCSNCSQRSSIGYWAGRISSPQQHVIIGRSAAPPSSGGRGAWPSRPSTAGGAGRRTTTFGARRRPARPAAARAAAARCGRGGLAFAVDLCARPLQSESIVHE